MEAAPEEDQQSQSSIPKSSSFSPKVARPKLPSFTGGGKSSGTRHKTDPGRGEIKSIMEDIMNLNKVDFVKTYSRPRTLRSQTLQGKSSTSAHSSPSATPHVGSPDEPRASSLSRNRSTSRSLKQLTDKLKSGRYGDKGGSMVGDPAADTNSKVPGLSRQVELSEGDEVSLYHTPRQSTSDSPEKAMQLPSDAQDKTAASDPSAFVDDGDKADSIGSAGSSSRREKSPDPGDDSGPFLKVPEEEEHGEGEQPAPTASARPFHPTMSRNSPFLKLRATAPPQRRTGLTTIGTMGSLAWAKSPPSSTEEGGMRGEDQGSSRKPPRPRDGRQGAKVSPVLFVQHPHHRSGSFREDGGMDTNGLTVLKSSSGDSESEGLISPYSLGDGQMGDSQEESGFQDAMSYLGPDSLEPEYGERKNNGKSLKQKFNSDPSGHKTRELLELGASFASTHSHSAPSLVKEDAEGEISSDFLIQEEEGIRMRPKLPSEALLSPVIVDEGPMGQGSEDEFLEDSSDALSPTPKKSSSGFSPFSPPPSPHSHSPTGTMERDRSDPHRLSVNKRAISRSASTASVLNRDRKSLGSKDKEAVRKYSMTTDETMGGVKMGSSLTPDFTPIRDTGAAVSMPVVWKGPSTSDSPEREPTFIKDNRYHIVDELYRNEKEYVDALKTLKEKYMVPLKTQSSLGETIVDNIFYMIPEILTHHTIYLDSLDNVWKNWDSKTSTIGNIIIATFSRQSVLESYLFFVENYKSSGRVIENALQTKSSVQKFIEQCQRDSGNKLSMKDLIVRPIQRIPRYELLIQRLLDNTPKDHPDFPLLQQAEKVMHDLAVKIGTVNDSQHEEDMQETLKKLEDLLMTELAVPDRTYLRHDIVQILTKKDQCCIWLFSDLIIISSIKRKSGPVTRKVSIILKTPYGQDFTENVKQKTWLRVGLDDIEIVKSQGSLTRKPTVDRDQLEDDLALVSQISELSARLATGHQALDEALKELSSSLSRQMSECQMRSPTSESNKMELLVTTQESVLNLVIAFPTAEKRATWESAFVDAKSKLSLLSDRRAPEFLQPLQITKTRAGMQFSCAAPIDGVNSKGYRDVWVCNSDGYVGHMCLLSLQPEPIVTLNTPVPGCNARILCICAVPAYGGAFRRKTSQKGRVKTVKEDETLSEAPRINVETVEDEEEEGDTADGYQTDSESSEDDEELSYPHTRELYVASDDEAPRHSSPSPLTQASMDPITTSGNWVQDAHKSTMWMGTEDGCIHIFQCTDNIKTTKNKLKIQHGSAVQCIVYLDNKVFVSLCNGDLIVYKRDAEGLWDTEHPYTRTIGTASAPITRMLAVAGKLWCGCQNNIHVINPLTFNIEETFQVTSDTGRSVQCMVSSGQGVWIASQQSSKVNLFHATTYEFLMEVSIAPAVAQKLQSADDIIRQHKAACLRITALLICKDLMWVGTSAGVILSIPIPKITSTTTYGSLPTPTVTGLVHGHTGHVRFLTCVELSCIPPKPDGVAKETAAEGSSSSSSHGPDLHRRSSMAATTATMASRMLVISGGDGYEDFRNSSTNEAAGRDDSTNHLLLWQV